MYTYGLFLHFFFLYLENIRVITLFSFKQWKDKRYVYVEF